MYLAGNGGRRRQLPQTVFVDADGPEPKATTAGRQDWIADPDGSFRLDRTLAVLRVDRHQVEVVGNLTARKPNRRPDGEEERSRAVRLDAVAVRIVGADWPMPPCRDKEADGQLE